MEDSNRETIYRCQARRQQKAQQNQQDKHLPTRQGSEEMTNRLNMTSKDFDFLADTFKKMYRSAVATEVPGVIWAEKLLVEEIKSRCHHFNEALWNVAVGFEDIRNTYEVPEHTSLHII